jgi:hypothetical protein
VTVPPDPPSAEERAYLAAQRPSRIRDVQAGAVGWAGVRLIDIDDGHGVALRLGLEAFGLHVEYVRVGQARHLIGALNEPPQDYVLLACHGDEGQLLVPELAAELERFQPTHGPWGPDEVRRHARLAGATVIATGCDTGTSELAQAFLDAGATAYVAPAGAPFGYASLFAPLLLFYELTEGRTLTQAVEHLRGHDAELAIWRLYP